MTKDVLDFTDEVVESAKKIEKIGFGYPTTCIVNKALFSDLFGDTCNETKFYTRDGLITLVPGFVPRFHLGGVNTDLN